MTLKHIIYYPIKSLQGIEASEHNAHPLGLQWDRRWMLIEEDGRFVSQRQDPMLARLQVSSAEEGWKVEDPEYGNTFIPQCLQQGQAQAVEVWGDRFEALHNASIADDFFSSFLGRRVRLVHHHMPQNRPVDERYTDNREYVGFADGFPYLVLSTASIEFCQRLCPDEQIDWRRFRPNLVFSAAESFVEDQYSRIQIGSAVFELVKPCARCVMITVDPETGQGGSSLLKALSPIRLQDKGIMVGQNALLREGSVLRVGDSVKCLG